MEVVADVCVWSIAEGEGYKLCNVQFNFSLARMLPLVLIVVSALSTITGGELMVPVLLVNATAAASNFTSEVNGSSIGNGMR